METLDIARDPRESQAQPSFNLGLSLSLNSRRK
jgi:hypothetical protein